MYIYIYIYICVCVCVCIHVYMYIYMPRERARCWLVRTRSSALRVANRRGVETGTVLGVRVDLGVKEAPRDVFSTYFFRWTETKWSVDLANGQTSKPATRKAANNYLSRSTFTHGGVRGSSFSELDHLIPLWAYRGRLWVLVCV